MGPTGHGRRAVQAPVWRRCGTRRWCLRCRQWQQPHPEVLNGAIATATLHERTGRYELLERIAAGGQGTVYRARDTTLDRIVAVKVINQPVTDDPQYLEALQREARLAAGLDHPNITTVHDFQVEDGTPYIVMEYVPDALDRHIQGGRRIPWQRATEIAIQIARALQHAHDKGVVHRDIKPQNILLREDGSVAVSDFGIARALASSTRSRTASVMGTPAYMSPEQWASGNLDGRLDQYALGIVLYEMLVGTAPFQAESMEALFVHHRESPMPALPRDLRVSSAVESVIRRATEKSQGARYASAGAMAEALQSATAEGTPGRPTPASPLPRPPQPPRAGVGGRAGAGGGRIGGIPSWLFFGGLGAILTAAVAVLVVIAATGGGDDGAPAAVVTPTETPVPTEAPTSTTEPTPIPPTDVPTSTPTATATPTTIPTSTPMPTYTPFPTATPRPTYTPRPTPTARVIVVTPTFTPRPTPTRTPRPTPTPDASFYFDKAYDYYDDGKYQLAVDEYTKAIQLDPASA